MQWSTRSGAQSCADGLSFTMEAQGGLQFASGLEDFNGVSLVPYSFSVVCGAPAFVS